MAHRDRQREGVRVALRGRALDRRAAGIAEPEQPRGLVERLAGGVVERLARGLGASRGRVPRRAACGRRWRSGRERRLERIGVQEGSPRRGPGGGRPGSAACRVRGGERLRRVDSPTSRAPISPGSVVTAIASTSIEAASGVARARLDDGIDQLEVAPRGDLGHDPAEAGVHAACEETTLLSTRGRRRGPPRRCRRRMSRWRGSRAHRGGRRWARRQSPPGAP